MKYKEKERSKTIVWLRSNKISPEQVKEFNDRLGEDYGVLAFSDDVKIVGTFEGGVFTQYECPKGEGIDDIICVAKLVFYFFVGAFIMLMTLSMIKYLFL